MEDGGKKEFINSKSRENLKVMYTNIDVITNKQDELRANIEVEAPDIIAIAEIKVKNYRYELSRAEISIAGYELYTVNLNNNVGRGVALYISNGLESEELMTDSDFQESVWF